MYQRARQKLRGAKLRSVAAATEAVAVGRSLAANAWRKARSARVAGLLQSKEPVVLFVAPEAGLRPFYASHVYLARTLEDKGHAALLLSCNGLLPTCSVKSATGVGATAIDDSGCSTCVDCRASATGTTNSYRLLDLPMETVLNGETARIRALVASAGVEPWAVEYDGMPFGRVALGETLRTTRKSQPRQLTDADIETMRAFLFSSLAIYVAVKRLTEQANVVKIAYFGDYAYHIPLIVLGERSDIPVTHVSHAYAGDIDRRYVSLRPGFAYGDAMKLVHRWKDYRDQAVPSAAIEQVLQILLDRLRGHGGISNFSPNWQFTPGDVRKQIGLRADRKTIALYASSTDEIVCADEFMKLLGVQFDKSQSPFADQEQWLAETIRWVGTRTDLQMVLRLHPRMAAGVRMKADAADLDMLRETLRQLPDNVVVVWPESPVSSYNISEVADVALTAWSSMAIELSRLGLPVVSAFPSAGLVPTGSFIRAGASVEEYFGQIESGCYAAPSLENMIEAFRWTNFLYRSHLIDVSDLIDAPDLGVVPDYKKLAHAADIVSCLADDQDLVELNMRRLRQQVRSDTDEMASMLRAISKLVALLGTGSDVHGGDIVQMREVASGKLLSFADSSVAVRIDRDGWIEAAGQPGTRRYSRMCWRLGEMMEAFFTNPASVEVVTAS